MTRDNKIRWASIFVTLIGLGDSMYLTWIKLAHQEVACGIGDCDTVNSSIYSEIGGIPIALLGTGAYLVILLALLFEERTGYFQKYALQMIYGLSIVGVLYSAYLTYIEIVVLRAICPFCVVSAIMMLILLILTMFRLFQSQPQPELE